jgi:hypothetical protein
MLCDLCGRNSLRTRNLLRLRRIDHVVDQLRSLEHQAQLEEHLNLLKCLQCFLRLPGHVGRLACGARFSEFRFELADAGQQLWGRAALEQIVLYGLE